MTTKDYAERLLRGGEPFCMELSTVDTINNRGRNDRIDVGFSQLSGFSTTGDIYGIYSVCFTFPGGILRVHFPEGKGRDKWEKDYLEIAGNMLAAGNLIQFFKIIKKVTQTKFDSMPVTIVEEDLKVILDIVNKYVKEEVQ